MKKVGLWVALLGLLALIAFRRWSSIAPPATAPAISPGDSTLARSSPSSSEYRLPSGAVLAYLPHPSAAARAWVADQYGMNADEIISATVVWDAEPRLGPLEVGFVYKPRTLHHALYYSLGVERPAVEFRDGTESIEVPGDWVVRAGAAQDEYFTPLEAALRANGHPRLQIAKTARQRVRYVVSGEAAQDGQTIAIFDARPEMPEAPLRRGTLTEFFSVLGRAIGAEIESRVASGDSLTVAWRDNSPVYAQLGPPITAEMTEAAVQRASESLNLTFTRSLEPASLWVLAEPSP